MNLTQKELQGLEDQLGSEQLLVAKYSSFAKSTTDPQLRKSFEEIASRHRDHYERLRKQLA